jgi:hypothetical protein
MVDPAATCGVHHLSHRRAAFLAELYEARAETPPKVERGETRLPLGFEPAGFAFPLRQATGL